MPGEDNILPDALSRLYANDAPGTVHALSEYVHLADNGLLEAATSLVSMPILVAAQVDAGTPGLRWSNRANKGHLCDHLDPGAPVACLQNGQRRGRNTRGPQASSGAKGLPKGHTGPTTSGRPETAAKFAQQVKDRFVLRSPCERTVGGEVDTFTRIDESTSDPESHNASDWPSGDTETQIPLTFLDNNDLLGKLKNNYGKDSFLKLILDDSDASHYRNFEECDSYIQLWSKEQTAICILNVMVDGRSMREQLIEQAHLLLAHLGTVAQKVSQCLHVFH